MTELERKISYEFKGIAGRHTLQIALTHSSHSKPCNERLEVLGDKVLNMLITERLFSASGNESQLVGRVTELVCNNNLYHTALMLHLGEYLYLGPAELCNGGRTKRNILADALEAIIGAVYLDGGLDAARTVVNKLVR